jgi:hypothetical protein
MKVKKRKRQRNSWFLNTLLIFLRAHNSSGFAVPRFVPRSSPAVSVYLGAIRLFFGERKRIEERGARLARLIISRSEPVFFFIAPF